MAEEEILPREKVEFSLTSLERGKIVLTIFDRITVDDVFEHLVNEQVYSVVSRKTVSGYVDPLFKDFLLKEKFTAGQKT